MMSLYSVLSALNRSTYASIWGTSVSTIAGLLDKAPQPATIMSVAACVTAESTLQNRRSACMKLDTKQEEIQCQQEFLKSICDVPERGKLTTWNPIIPLIVDISAHRKNLTISTFDGVWNDHL